MSKTLDQQIREEICAAYLCNENDTVSKLINELDLDSSERGKTVEDATSLVEQLRETDDPGVMETFLSEYGLTTEEGVALMCLAEALLRVPDDITVDALISDKIAPADWSKHLGHSASPLVNASTWGLMLTGKVVNPVKSADWDVVGQLRKLIKRVGEPVIRTAVSQSMKILGHQFVLGRDIGEAMDRAKAMEEKGYTYSYDMLGEAARTAEDAQRYFMSYARAISTLSEHSSQDDIRENPGISVKLSALHPRYEFSQKERVMNELVPRLSSLVFQAKNANMGLNIDAEEADRLDLSLDVIEAVLSNTDLKGWHGFGVVVQAYGPRAGHVLDWLYELSNRLDRKVMVRLVKGAYWDTEIKLSQVNGYEGYPVFTRKASTDVSYLACAKKLLSMRDRIYPQFATHNAHSIAAVLNMAKDTENYEFQRLHGMGEGLHDLVMEQHQNRCRIYAPVGIHEDLLAYLVRRLLENGANSSFVNRVLDKSVPAKEVVQDPVETIESASSIENPTIPLPKNLYAGSRDNSSGINFPNPSDLKEFQAQRQRFSSHQWNAGPIMAGKMITENSRVVFNPSLNKDHVGSVTDATKEDVTQALETAIAAEEGWRDREVEERAAMLEKIADLYEANRVELMALLGREAGKSVFDGISEVREAADFCRFYAAEARKVYSSGQVTGRGTFVCISPWNFPLAIFTGQIVAALVAGNPVIAKPAEQSPLIAARAIELMLEAGIPGNVIQLLPGEGSIIGARLVSDPGIKGVCFTGSTETAQRINKAMSIGADPEAPLIAETGGLNAMIVDSSALPEQAVRDIVASAFQSAGQRCSALRVLYVQEDIADKIVTMLKGAMDELKVGDPWDISVDVGPVIDGSAKTMIDSHCADLTEKGRLIHVAPLSPQEAEAGTFVAPIAFRLEGIHELSREVFGPVLHIVTFKAEDFGDVVEKINATGFGLTLGIHTRVDTRVQDVTEKAHVGNMYVNRNQIGAVVGVQPFGGEGLSGTGPKAGGFLYLHRFTRNSEHGDISVNKTTQQPSSNGKIDVPSMSQTLKVLNKAKDKWEVMDDRHQILEKAAEVAKNDSVRSAIITALAQTADYHPDSQELAGPTGESNRLSLKGRGIILCNGPNSLSHAAIALATGNAVLVTEAGDKEKALVSALKKAGAPAGLVEGIEDGLTDEIVQSMPAFAGLSTDAESTELRAFKIALANREGPIIPLITDPSDWRNYVSERALCIDTTASGGNATLLAANEG
ncbi:MAG: bifunctional proline dehydrogenase/L-glutamate gamma-semialdehyde dehydrogenase PutA [Proteobacteria bacterium]|nr:bifunctional proline dehydrogenase/L-glutamate gamma-semialdehyde dehydrogenase PutA [Pseudomonadota bacterium]